MRTLYHFSELPNHESLVDSYNFIVSRIQMIQFSRRFTIHLLQVLLEANTTHTQVAPLTISASLWSLSITHT